MGAACFGFGGGVWAVEPPTTTRRILRALHCGDLREKGATLGMWEGLSGAGVALGVGALGREVHLVCPVASRHNGGEGEMGQCWAEVGTTLHEADLARGRDRVRGG